MAIENTNIEKNNIVVLNNDRSYLKSLFLGIREAMNHLGTLTRYMWPSILLSIILPFPGILFFWGQRDALLRRWTKLGYLPSVGPKALRADLFPCVGRALFSFIIIILCLVACCLIFTLPAMRGKIWYGIIALVVLILLLLPFNLCIWESSWSERKVIRCLGGYVRGFRHYGKIFSFLLLNLIIYSIVALIAILPLSAASLTQLEVFNARAMGELALLPLNFYILLALAYIIFMIVMLYCDLVYSFSACLCWGSIEEVPTDSEVEASRIDGIVG